MVPRSHPSSQRSLAWVWLLALGGTLGGCGASQPQEADIYHDPLLRPSVVHAEGPDAQLLARLDEVSGEGTLQVGGAPVAVETPYPAASGRVCRSVGERLACRSEDGWEFVPVVLPTAGVTPDEAAP
ncbi:MAG: hypothetical protein AB8I08_37265 [Sandaracinaceae bacterium]